MKKGDHALFVACYLALIVVCTISFTAWIGMYQSANIDKANEMFTSSLKDTVQMDADTPFITNLPSLDDKTTTIKMVDEPKMSIFGCLYSYLQNLPPNWSLIFGAFTTVYISLNGVFTLYQANSVPHNSKSVNCLKPKFFKRSYKLFMLAVFLVNSIAMGVQVQVQAPLKQVSLYHFPTMTYFYTCILICCLWCIFTLGFD